MSRGPLLLKPYEAGNGFPKPWWARHRIESLGAELQEEEAQMAKPQ
jgi:hypothetical protein